MSTENIDLTSDEKEEHDKSDENNVDETNKSLSVFDEMVYSFDEEETLRSQKTNGINVKEVLKQYNQKYDEAIDFQPDNEEFDQKIETISNDEKEVLKQYNQEYDEAIDFQPNNEEFEQKIETISKDEKEVVKQYNQEYDEAIDFQPDNEEFEQKIETISKDSSKNIATSVPLENRNSTLLLHLENAVSDSHDGYFSKLLQEAIKRTGMRLIEKLNEQGLEDLTDTLNELTHLSWNKLKKLQNMPTTDHITTESDDQQSKESVAARAREELNRAYSQIANKKRKQHQESQLRQTNKRSRTSSIITPATTSHRFQGIVPLYVGLKGGTFSCTPKELEEELQTITGCDQMYVEFIRPNFAKLVTEKEGANKLRKLKSYPIGDSELWFDEWWEKKSKY